MATAREPKGQPNRKNGWNHEGVGGGLFKNATGVGVGYVELIKNR